MEILKMMKIIIALLINSCHWLFFIILNFHVTTPIQLAASHEGDGDDKEYFEFISGR